MKRAHIDAILAQQPDSDEGVPLSAFLRHLRSRSVESCGCWVWQGATADSGVPVTHRNTGLKKPNGHALMQTLPARRAIVEDIAAGPMRPGFVSALLCETTLCVNPWHVMSTTKPVQAAIAAKRGAWSSPQKTAAITKARRRNSPFSEAVIEYVRTSEKSGKDVAAEVGMSTSHACNIRIGRVRRQASPFDGLRV